MKKIIISVTIALLLSLCACTFVGCGQGHQCTYDEHTGYMVIDNEAHEILSCTCGKNQYSKLEDAYVATPQNAQQVLDGALGSLDGKTVVFAPGEYNDTLYFGRPNSLAGSNTVYKGLQGSTIIEGIDEISDMTWGSRYYTRSISNVTFGCEEGVVLPSIEAISGHVHGSGHDYVIDKDFTGSGYYLTHIFENITFDGVSFDGIVKFSTSQVATEVDGEVFQPATSMNGLKFDGCDFTTGGTEQSNGAALQVYSETENDNQVIKNVSVDNCRFENCYQGVYTHHVQNVSVKNSSFNSLGHNAIAIQNHGSTPFNHGNVVISNNTFNNILDRIIRFNNIGAETTITISNNTANNSGDEDKQVIKATTLADGIVYDISNKSWGDGTVIANSELEDQQ